MIGFNSEKKNQVEFVPTKNGINQMYMGYSKHGIEGKNDSKLPNIRMDRQAVRTNEFMKVSDDACSRRFVQFDYFPPNSTKANIKQPRTINFKTALNQCDSIKPKVQYNSNNYEVSYKAIKGKKEQCDTLVPFDR